MNEMTFCTPSDTQALARWLRQDDIPCPQVLIGFDGYVDTIYRVVKTRIENGEPQFYDRIVEYGQRILDTAGKSGDMDICLIRKKMGGNAPLMADGMAALENHVSLIGALGLPMRHPYFDELHPAVNAVSFAEPFHTIGFEFDDGKIMMGHIPTPITWEQMVSTLGLDGITREVRQADLIALLNWSAHFGVGRVAAKIARLADPSTLLFFDLSDPTSLRREQLLDCLEKLAAIGTQRPTVLGMNENEARAVLRCLFPRADGKLASLLQRHGMTAAKQLHFQALVVHSTGKAFALTPDACWQADGYLVHKPQYLIGGGDHFNAGFCHGLVHRLTFGQCLILGNAAASFFVQNGYSAAKRDLLRLIESNPKEVHPS